jgi:hypothetical protein
MDLIQLVPRLKNKFRKAQLCAMIRKPQHVLMDKHHELAKPELLLVIQQNVTTDLSQHALINCHQLSVLMDLLPEKIRKKLPSSRISPVLREKLSTKPNLVLLNVLMVHNHNVHLMFNLRFANPQQLMIPLNLHALTVSQQRVEVPAQ